MAAHYELTAGEIIASFSALDYVFVGVSTAGTIAGVSRRLKAHFPDVKVVAVDAEGSAIFGQRPRRRYIPGIGSSIVPDLLRHALIDDTVHVRELDTIEACHELLREHQILAGGSSGSSYAAIKSYPFPEPSPTVLFLCADRGTAYMDTVYDAALGRLAARTGGAGRRSPPVTRSRTLAVPTRRSSHKHPGCPDLRDRRRQERPVDRVRRHRGLHGASCARRTWRTGPGNRSTRTATSFASRSARRRASSRCPPISATPSTWPESSGSRASRRTWRTGFPAPRRSSSSTTARTAIRSPASRPRSSRRRARPPRPSWRRRACAEGRPQPRTLGIVGNGLIARYLYEFFVRTGWTFPNIRLYDAAPGESRRFSERLALDARHAVVHDEAIEPLLRASDLILFATTAGAPYVHDTGLFAHNPIVLNISLRDLGTDVISGFVQRGGRHRARPQRQHLAAPDRAAASGIGGSSTRRSRSCWRASAGRQPIARSSSRRSAWACSTSPSATGSTTGRRRAASSSKCRTSSGS